MKQLDIASRKRPPSEQAEEALTGDAVPAVLRMPLLGPALSWWLDHTSNSRYSAGTFDERIRRRRSRVGSGIFLGLIVLALALLVWEQLTVSDLPTFYALVAALAGLSLGCVLNRYNRVELAGALVALVIIAAILGAVLSAPNGLLDTDYLGSYYLLALVLGVVAILMPAWGLLATTTVNCVLILADFLVLQQYTPALTQQLAADGYFFEIGRPIFLNIGIAFALYILVRTLLGEGRRADRAEELALLEQRELDRQRVLEEEVRELLAVHVQLANGNFNARVPQLSNPLLWQIGASLNNLMNRLARLGQADFAYQRTQQETLRLAEALQVLLEGRMPVWPAPTGMPTDTVLMSLQTLLARLAAGDPVLVRQISQAMRSRPPDRLPGAQTPTTSALPGFGSRSQASGGGRGQGSADRPPWRTPQLQPPMSSPFGLSGTFGAPRGAEWAPSNPSRADAEPQWPAPFPYAADAEGADPPPPSPPLFPPHPGN